VAFFGDRWKEPDRTVQIIGTAVRSEKYGPVWKIRSGLKYENGDCKRDRTVRSGTLGPQSGPVYRNSRTGPYSPVLDWTVVVYIYVIYFYRIPSLRALLLSVTPDPT
jgi:hypothetical protein